MSTNKLKLFRIFQIFLFLSFSIAAQSQIWNKLSNLISPSQDTSRWELIEIEKINCSFKMPGQPIFELDSNFVNGNKIDFYSVEYETGIRESLSFLVYSTHFPIEEINSESMDKNELDQFYEEQIALANLMENPVEIQQLQLSGYPAAVTKLTMFGDLIKIKYAVVLVKNRIYTFSVHYDSYPEIQIPYFLNSFTILEK